MYNEMIMEKPTGSQIRRHNTTQNYICRYCHHGFIHENRYLNHNCKQMKRLEELKSPTGQAALRYYQVWMKIMKRAIPSDNSFLTSNFFRTFINFTDFTKKVNLPFPEKFIWLMVQKKFSPTMWVSEDVYMIYLEFIDKKVSPLEQALNSVETLINYADKEEIDPSDIFTKITPIDFIQLLRTRKLSPWLLLFSKKFKEFYANNVSPEQQVLINNLISPDQWEIKLKENPTPIIEIKKLIKELGI